ncbi:MAG: hypothetical protein QM731_23390 [Chitinophagaceae bacterium]
MLAIVIPMNVFLLGGLLILAVSVGFIIRSTHVASLNKKIGELEKEMLTNHAEILELQREKAGLEQRLKESHIPVIPISSVEEEKVMRNKLSQQSIKKHS